MYIAIHSYELDLPLLQLGKTETYHIATALIALCKSKTVSYSIAS